MQEISYQQVILSLNHFFDTQVEEWLAYLGIGSIFMFGASMLATVAVIMVLPADHFLCRFRSNINRSARALSPLRIFTRFFKNLIGIGLLVAGLAMLVLPGQGLLTILIGIYLLDFPGKAKLINKMLKNQNLRRTLNWIRQKFKRPPFVFDEEKL